MIELVYETTSLIACMLQWVYNWLGQAEQTRAGIILGGYILTLCFSGMVVRYFVGSARPEATQEARRQENSGREFDVGFVIGKCENILTVTLVLAGGYTGLGLLFTAKTIVRAEDMKSNPKFYLGGTLVNVTYSVVIASAVKVALKSCG